MFIGDNFLEIVDIVLFVLVAMEGKGFFEKLFGRDLRCFFMAFDEFISGGRRT